MTSFIDDNGIESELNRGRFFGYRNGAGMLEGVALIGHSTLVETRSVDALKALAISARRTDTPIHLIISSGDNATRFWNYPNGTKAPRHTCTEALFEIGFPFAVQNCERTISNARPAHLMQVAKAKAEVTFIECGVDPLVRDREGFLKRVARRIDQDRVFVVMDGDDLVFKAEIIAETENTMYLEGVYVSPNHRGIGIGSKCLSALAMELPRRAETICLLSNVDFEKAHSSFYKAGFRKTDTCTTLVV